MAAHSRFRRKALEYILLRPSLQGGGGHRLVFNLAPGLARRPACRTRYQCRPRLAGVCRSGSPPARGGDPGPAGVVDQQRGRPGGTSARSSAGCGRRLATRRWPDRGCACATRAGRHAACTGHRRAAAALRRRGRPKVHRAGLGASRPLADHPRPSAAETRPQGQRARPRHHHARAMDAQPLTSPREKAAEAAFAETHGPAITRQPPCSRRLRPPARRPVPRPPAARWRGARRRPSLPWPCAPGGRPCRCLRGSGGRR